MRLLAYLLAITILGGCASSSAIREKVTGKQFDEPVIEINTYLEHPNNKISPPFGGPIAVAVYGFQDKTGQRKSLPGIASLSSAVTQGGESYLIKALQDAGDARWFTVVERVGLDNLIKERQMIRQQREMYHGREAKQLPPMVNAGIIVEGAIVGYDSNTITGGSGMRIFGIGASTQYQSDTVTISLRTVSVLTGEVLTSVSVEKNLLSTSEGISAFTFFNQGTNAFEIDSQQTKNEPGNYAIRSAIETGVVELIKSGEKRGLWHYKTTQEQHK